MTTGSPEHGIEFRVGDATEPAGEGQKVIVHVCNDIGAWGLGFVLALSRRWAEPEAAYLKWHAESAQNDFALGAVQLVRVRHDIRVANLIGQRDVVAGPDGPPIRYDAIERGLGALIDEATSTGASVHMPRIGCGLAGGDWSRVEAIIDRTLVAAPISVTVYDLAQPTRSKGRLAVG